MGCFSFRPSKSPPSMKASNPIQSPQENPEPKKLKQEVLLQIPGCRAHLMDGGEALELANGEFKLERIMEDEVSLATIIKVGEDLQWPLTKDEPVVKLNSLNYLFSLPMKDGDPLSYGVTFLEQNSSSLSWLDLFLKDNSCFSSSSCNANNKNIINWKEYAPKIDDYNNILAKAIAQGTGQIVQGIFKCSNSYANQVLLTMDHPLQRVHHFIYFLVKQMQIVSFAKRNSSNYQVNKGGEMILSNPPAAGVERSGSSPSTTQNNKTAINRS